MSLKADKITLSAPAKVNLFLDITGKLENGYHTLNTVMQQISLADIVEIEAKDGDGCTVRCDNPDIPCDERNIAFKACRAFLEAVGEKAHVDIFIKKNIPVEAGLGGSSTDGAAVLKGLNSLYGKPLTREQLCEIGAGLGADVPFCIKGGAAICTGVGEKMESLHIPGELFYVIIKPHFANNTGKAYALYDQKPVPVNGGFDGFIRMLRQGEAEKAAKSLYNVFQRLYEDRRIEEICGALLKVGALGASMSGSGSAVFGMFTDKKAAEAAAEKLSCKKPFTAAGLAFPDEL